MNLFRDPRGQFSASKMWTTVAYAVATYIVLIKAETITWELLLVYLSVVGGSEVAKKFLNMKYGNRDQSNGSSS